LRLVPGGQPELEGPSSDLRLGQPRFGQRGEDAVLPRSGMAGSMISKIIRVESVEDGAQAELLPHLLAELVELGFAKGAAVGGVRRVAGIRQLVRMDNLVPYAQGRRQVLGVLRLAFRHRRGNRGQRHGARTEHIKGNLQHERGVHTAGKGDQGGSASANLLADGIKLRGGLPNEQIELPRIYHAASALAGS